MNYLKKSQDLINSMIPDRLQTGFNNPQKLLKFGLIIWGKNAAVVAAFLGLFPFING